MTELLLFVMTLAVIVVSVFYRSVKRENRDLRRSLLADDASELWVYLVQSRQSLAWVERDGLIDGFWRCGNWYHGASDSSTPDGAVRKHRAMKRAAERVEAELREDA